MLMSGIHGGHYMVAGRYMYEFHVPEARTTTHSFAVLTRDTLFLPQEHKIHIFELINV